jgi:hypothetical protein
LLFINVRKDFCRVVGFAIGLDRLTGRSPLLTRLIHDPLLYAIQCARCIAEDCSAVTRCALKPPSKSLRVENPETAKAEEIVAVSTPGTGDAHLFLRKYTGMHHWDRLSRRALHSAAIARVAQAPSAPEQSWRNRGGRLRPPRSPTLFFSTDVASTSTASKDSSIHSYSCWHAPTLKLWALRWGPFRKSYTSDRIVGCCKSSEGGTACGFAASSASVGRRISQRSSRSKRIVTFP